MASHNSTQAKPSAKLINGGERGQQEQKPKLAAGMGKSSAQIGEEPGKEVDEPGKGVDEIQGKADESANEGSEVSLQDSSMQEAESDQNYAPEEAIEEEERLRKQREDANKEELQEIFKSEDDGVLSSNDFGKLDKLIEQTSQFSTFLSEQMKDLEQKARQGQETADADKDAKAGDKRKKSGRAAGKNKKAKTEETGKTQALFPLITGELRDYQLQGVRWMISLWQNGLNGILADQMGLGKTIQTIAFLSHLYQRSIYGPFMIVAPLSTLSNWVNEFERFCPSLKTVLYHGSKKERSEIRSKKLDVGKNKAAKKGFPVVITSYEIVMADLKFLQQFGWKYVIVDEGHRLKNWNCKLLRELRTLQAGNKMILSGTPLQNNLSELWSLLNFLLPEVFSSMSTFESWFDFTSFSEAAENEKAQEQRSQVLTKLHAVLKPFLLRRIKSDVETSLPAKKEIILYAHMTDLQKKYNQDLRDRTLNEVLTKQQAAEGGRKVSKTKLNNMIMQMRKNCNHPDLISSAFTNDVMYPSSKELLEQSGKLQLLNRLLNKLKAKGHRVLIFSQMTKMLDILDTFLEQEGHKSCRLDGSVAWQDRKEAMDKFKASKDLFVFLLSTRAGGLGINLTQADTVIIYDSDWNPHQDLQAMDRAHRIGQENPVLVLRLASANSVDGRILKRANSKLMLERLVIRKGAFIGEEEKKGAAGLSNEELMELLKDTIPLKDEPQSGVVSDKVMDSLLDRTHLVEGNKAPYKDAAVGYEIVKTAGVQGLLSAVQ